MANIVQYVNLQLVDNTNLKIGTGEDLELHHNATDSYIQNSTGNLNIINYADDKDIIFKSDDGSGGITEYFKLDGSSKRIDIPDSIPLCFGTSDDLQIQHNGSSSYIQNYTGDLIILNAADDSRVRFQCDDGSGGTATYFDLQGSQAGARLYTNWYDNSVITLGNGLDVQIYHDATDSHFYNQTGHLYFKQAADNKDIYFQNDDGSGGLTTYFYVGGSAEQTIFVKNTEHQDGAKAQFGNIGDMQLYHDSNHSYIINGTGNLYIAESENDGDIVFQCDDGSGGLTEYFKLDGAFTKTIFSRDIWAQDNVKALFGTSSDLEIYHDGSNSYIDETGTGGLYARASDSIYIQKSDGSSNMAQFTAGGGSHLYHNNNLKFSTTSTGVDVTGEVKGDSLNIDGSADISGQVNVAERIHIGGATSGTKTLSFESTTNAQNYDIDYYNNAGTDTVQGKIRYLEGAGSIELHPNFGAGASLILDWSNNATFAGNIGMTGTGHIGADDNFYVGGATSGTDHTYIGDNNRNVTIYNGATFTVASGVTTLGGSLTVNDAVTITEQIYHSGDSNTYFGFHNNDEWRVVTGGTERLEVSNSGIKLSSSGSTVNTILDEDNMVSDSATALATQQSIKAYVDNATTGVLTYQGTWNANTNSPTLSSGSGTPGYYYIVSTAGSTNLDGITDWAVGDWAVFSDQATDAWQKIDNTAVGNISGSGVSSRVAYWNGTGTITSTAGFTFDGSNLAIPGYLTISGNQIVSPSNLTIDVGGDITLDADGGDVFLKDAGSTFGTLQHSGFDFIIKAATNDKDIKFNGFDNGSGITALTLDMSDAGNATFNSNVLIPSGYVGRDTHNYITFETDNQIVVRVEDSHRLKLTSAAMLPYTDSSYDLGSTSLRYSNIWVDNINGGTPTTGGPYLALAGGTMTGDVVYNDSIKIKLGTGGGNSDIYHNGTDMYIRNLTTAGDMSFAADSTGSGGAATSYFWLDGGIVKTRFAKEATFADNVKLTFGNVTTPDLEIYHDASHSYIDATGTGDLYVMSSNDDVIIQAADDVFIYTQGGEDAVICRNNAQVELYYDNTKKFETTSAGGTITGALSITGDGSNATTLTETGAGLLTIATVDDLVLDSGSDITLDANGNDIRLFNAGVEYGKFKNDSSDLSLYSSIQDKDILFKGNDGGSTITALTLDMSAAGAATFNSNITLLSRITFDYGGDHYLESGTNTWNFKNSSGSTALTINHSDQSSKFFGNVTIPSYIYHKDDPSDDTYFGFSGNDTFVVYTAGGNGLNIDSNRDVTFTGSLTVPSRIYHSGDTDTYIGFPAADHFDINCGNTTFLSIDGTNLTLAPSGNINVNSADVVLSGDSNIVLDTSVSSTQSSGTIIKIGSHMSALVAGNIYYAYNSMGSLYWGGADADSSNTEHMIALSVGTDADVDGMLLNGIYHKASHGLTVGDPIYLSTTPMTMTNTAPSGTGDYVRVLGYAIDSNHIYFCPDNTWVKID